MVSRPGDELEPGASFDDSCVNGTRFLQLVERSSRGRKPRRLVVADVELRLVRNRRAHRNQTQTAPRSHLLPFRTLKLHSELLSQCKRFAGTDAIRLSVCRSSRALRRGCGCGGTALVSAVGDFGRFVFAGGGDAAGGRLAPQIRLRCGNCGGQNSICKSCCCDAEFRHASHAWCHAAVDRQSRKNGGNEFCLWARRLSVNCARVLSCSRGSMRRGDGWPFR